MKRFGKSAVRRRLAATALASAALLAGTGAASAQDNAAQGAPESAGAAQADILDQLKTCQRLDDDSARLACLDERVGALLAASEAGDVRLVDREDVRRTRRQLFGFSVPDIELLQGNENDREDTDTLTTTITRVRYFPRGRIELVTAEGAKWEIFKAPRRLADVEPGDSVEFKKAALGTFFIRINGQMGVKGKRIE